jgi:hypothetical protein
MNAHSYSSSVPLSAPSDTLKRRLMGEVRPNLPAADEARMSSKTTPTRCWFPQVSDELPAIPKPYAKAELQHGLH